KRCGAKTRRKDAAQRCGAKMRRKDAAQRCGAKMPVFSACIVIIRCILVLVDSNGSPGGGSMSEHSALRMTKEAVKEDILKKPNVIGIGVGLKEVQGQLTDQVSIVVLVRDKVPRAGLTPSQMVPPRVNSYETDVVEVGVIRAQQARTDRWRPAPGGVSIAHYQVTAGTLGAVVRDRATGQR